MAPEKSGFYYPNKFARITIEALEEVMGKNGLNAILNLAGLSELINNYPPDNLDKQFDFAYFTALCTALEEMYGPRGGRGLALRAGRATVADALRGSGALAGVGHPALKDLPRAAQLRTGLPDMAAIFTQFSDRVTNVHGEGARYIYTLERCPMCWNRKADRPVCYVGQGLLQ